MIQETYRQYLHIRNTNSAEEEKRRLLLKADLSRDINEGKGEWYLQRLKRPAKGFQMTYGEVAARLSDTSFKSGEKREPSLAEAVLATEKIDADYMTIRETLLPNCRLIIKVGSSTWAKNFDVKGEKCNPSDLDLEVLFDEINPERYGDIPGLSNALSIFRHYFASDEADYMAFGFTKGSRPVSIHFTSTEVFKENCHRDYFTDVREVRSREFRTQPKSKPPHYEQRDANGNLHVFNGNPRQVDGGQITETPVMMRGDQGQIVMGLIMDKYFSYPTTEGDTQLFEDNVGFFKRNLAEHLKDKGGSFSGFPSRRNRMPYYLLNQLDEEQKHYV